MAEAPAQTPPPRDIESSALTDTDSSAVTDLLNHLSQKSYDYDSHVQLVNLLHKGFLAHVYSPVDSADQETRDPRSYALLTELRQAREAMDTRFAVGEDLWVDWLSDEVILAHNSEERISVTELCGKAVQDEPASLKLWQIYADWVQNNYASCNNLEHSDQSKWTDEDKDICRELFTQDMLINVLEQGIQVTQWRIDQSHLLWNRYAELLLQGLPPNPALQDVDRVRNLFVQRLQVPQAAWSDTAQMLYQTMSRLDPNNWEVLMDQVSELSQPAKTQMGLREPHELDLQRAIDSGDKDAAYHELVKYIGWEKKQTKLKRRASFEPELLCTLYERALLLFPTYVDWWLDYIDFATSLNTSTAVLPLIERATRHCPWSGDLWARRILQSDVEGKSREDLEATKHRATNSGLLDVGGMEELLKVLQQWCSYLRRHAFSTANAEDEIDTAEFGISSALQDIDDAGRKVYGKEFDGDPLYRLEQVQIKFLSEARRFDEAREVYKSLAARQKHSHDFWVKWYHWELWLWGYDRIMEKHRVETTDNGPQRATTVIREAISQRNLDWPERVLDLFLNHFQQHESGLELRQALSEAREFSKQLAIRRAKEAEDAASAQQQAYPMADVQMVDTGDAPAGEKRKREEDAMPNGYSDKKPRTQTGPASTTGFGEPSGSASAQIKRDRENNTITIKNLPAKVQELDVRKFFRDVSDPVSITILSDGTSSTATATVEFSANEDVLAAKTRNGKELLGRDVRILSGSQSTLYVANYPPEHDEAAMRGLFEGYGEIISVRFPSLKFNNRRRFCYIQFLTTEMAQAAEAALDGKMLDGSHKLLAKISDPDAKKAREGAQAEGRELFVKNIDREARDGEVKSFFERYGHVVSMNLVKLVSGKKTGTAFIVFSSADGATKALDANNKPFNDRILHVEISSAKGRAAPLDRARREDINIKQSASPEPEAAQPNGRRGSNASSQQPQKDSDESWRTARERKVAVFNLPDTVNDARVRAAMEAHGPLVKIQMRRQDKGAIVEFATVQDAFNVRQGVECSALGEGVRTGDVGDLLAKVKKRQNEGGAEAGAGTGSMMRPPTISRPGAGGGRGRARGGLGFKRGRGCGAGRSAGGEGEGEGKRSNADFKAMFEKSRDEGA